MTNEYFGSRSKKGRGMAQQSLDLIKAMYTVAEAAQPITGRGVGYKLFTAGLTLSMEDEEMRRVYRLLRIAREEGTIPWEWIVDENRGLERVGTWNDPDHFAQCVTDSYRRDFWNQQSVRVQVWSEKGTARGLLAPMLNEYAVGFNPVHGFNSATNTHDVCVDDDGRELIILYVGDFDPSGMYMSEEDLPNRFAKYGGTHITLKRIALTRGQVRRLPSFPAIGQEERPPLPVVRRQPRRPVLGTRCDGPERSSASGQAGDREVD